MMINPSSNNSQNRNTPSSPIQVSDNNDGGGYLIMATNSAPGSFQNSTNNTDGFLGGGSGSDVEFGFLRPELLKQTPSLVGTVEAYQRHVFLCYKSPKVWPPHVEAPEFDRLPRLLSAALLARNPEINKKTRLTICEGHDGTETSNGDVLIFPDMIRYRRLTHFDVDTFVEEVLVKDSEWHPGTPETLSGTFVFVCSHGSRDRRCGVCGPTLVSRFREEIDVRGLHAQVSVSPCSHIGGHKYAGNLIIFAPNSDKQVTGHWYGYVTPDDVPILLDQHIGKGEIIDRLWRGQMGLSEEDQKKKQELRLQLLNENSMGNESKVASQAENHAEFAGSCQGNVTDLAGAECCQGNGKLCCQVSVSAEKVGNKHVVDKKETVAAAVEKKPSGKQRNRTINGKRTSTRKVCAMPTWFETWEREDTYAAIAVVGAIASVAIAYSSYKQLR